jgi:hypothetical protein
MKQHTSSLIVFILTNIVQRAYCTRGDAVADAMTLDVAVVIVEVDEDKVLLLKYSDANLRTSSNNFRGSSENNL